MRTPNAGLNCLRVAIVCTFGLLIAPGSQAFAQTYVYTALGSLGGTISAAYGINESGQVVGHSNRADNVREQAAMWVGGIATNLDASPTHSRIAYAINNAGMSVGQSLVGTGSVGHTSFFRATVWNVGTSTVLTTLPDTIHSDALAVNNSGQVAGRSIIVNHYHATVWNSGVPTDLGTGGGTDSYAYGINDSGQVAGTISYGSYSRAAVWNQGVPTSLGTLGGANGNAWAINASGQVAGYSQTADGSNRAATWNGISAVALGTLGGISGEARALNNLGQVVGYEITAMGGSRAILWNGTDVVDLNSVSAGIGPGWLLTVATGINDSGWIVGHAYNAGLGAVDAFLLTPVPEPEVFALLLAGLGVLSFAVRRRRTN